MPIIFYDGEKTTEVGLYQHYLLNLKNADLIEAGNTVPSMFGSVRNTFEWRRFSLDILLSYKCDYVFRATSIGPGDEYNSLPHYHTDLLRRWKYSGDERNTNVPAHSSTSNMARSQFYRQSEVLIENGAHIRLKDISLSYSLLSPISGIKWMKKASIYSNVKNLGVIWKASRNVTDPEYTGALYPMPRIYAFGVQIDF